MDMKAFFHPSRIAVIGASANPDKIGYSVLSNLIEAGYEGAILPVNPKETQILGRPVVNEVADLPRGLDMAVLTIPRDPVLPTLRQLAELGTKSVVIITAGFKEMGREGFYLEQEIREVAEKNDIALLGPNCLGLINSGAKVNVTFASGTPLPGNVAFFSQSGALCQAILDWAVGENMGFSKFVSLGNKAVINEAHMLDYLGRDPDTNVVLGYIENVSQGSEFLNKARAMSRKKPVLMIKSGTSTSGAKAASSHTGAIAGSDQAYEAAFQQGGIIRVRDIASLFTLAQAFSCQPLPQGPNLAVVTNSGGPGIMTADACERSKLHMARLSQETMEKMQGFLPSFASLHNPVDIIGDADAKRYKLASETVLEDQNVHALLILLTPTATMVSEMNEVADNIIQLAGQTDKPIFVCLMGKHSIAPAQEKLVQAGIPCYNFPEPVIQSLEAMYSYQQWRNRPEESIEEVPADRDRAEEIVNGFRSHLSPGRSVEIVEYQAQELLGAYDLPAAATSVATTSKEAVQAAEQMGYPVVLKVASPDISHKSDVGGVRMSLQSPEEVRQAFLEITSAAKYHEPRAFIHGCLVQEMAPAGMREIIVGFHRDEQFGPLLMFGLGGIHVEVFKDISFKLAPISRSQATDMIRGIQSYMLLKGVRGETGVKIKAIEDILIRVSQLAIDFPDIVEADLNPVLVDESRAIVADVRMTLYMSHSQ
ncbi:MAG: acetate--CoA ligase family protein [Desulfohalobiaceae bacterium]|nr:acetate--CoA ligase family protein [Desulfohalobiaceae bacterium]